MDTLFKAMQSFRGTTQNLEIAARNLRLDMTDAEKLLWAALRGRKLNGLKFRRQHPVGSYVLDFYCASAKRVVEVDGHGHLEHEQAEHDKLRTERLTSFGFRVMRLTNAEVQSDLAAVLSRILQAAASPPLPALGEGVGG